MLWDATVDEAASLDQDDVVTAMNHAPIAQWPGGPPEMVTGDHHVRMNMYIAQSERGTFKVVKNLGHIDPKECEVGRICLRRAAPARNNRLCRRRHVCTVRRVPGGARGPDRNARVRRTHAAARGRR